jgi:NADP-dependent 3-hydroxy acid dehydrogenase YdfG
MRTTRDTRDRLEAAATANGRSLAQEVEFRLERSFAEETAFGAPEMRQFVYLVAAAYARSAQFSAAGRRDWIHDRDCHIAGVIGMFQAALIGLSDEEAALVIQGLKSSLLTRIAQEREEQK